MVPKVYKVHVDRFQTCMELYESHSLVTVGELYSA